MHRSAFRKLLSTAAIAASVALAAVPAFADGPTSAQPTVCNIKVLSDKVPDVSSLEAWKKSFIKDGMTNQEKALAIWKSVVMFQYQDSPPVEYLQHEDLVYDPIKMFNVYGYGMCSPHSAHMEALARYIGFQARGWGINHHSVNEFFYDNAWHHFDSSVIDYFLKDDGTVAGVKDVFKSIADWYKEHPEFTGLSEKERDQKLRAFEKTDGRQGWKLHGPKLIASAPTIDKRGWWPAGTHGWYATMQDFDGTAGPNQKAFLYEYLASQGYQLNVQLRPGEKLTRNWSNEGKHINDKGTPDAMKDKEHFLANAEKFMDNLEPRYPNLTNGRIGNGLYEYKVPLASGAFKAGALEVSNLVSKSQDTTGAAVHVQDASKPGVLVIRMPSSYVYLDGSLTANAVIGDNGQIDVELSDNNGLDWKPVGKITSAGEEKLDLTSLIRRRYDYRLRFTLKGKGTGMEALTISNDIQHSQRPLPALDKGPNHITFSAGPQESTITVEANNSLKHEGKQLTYKDFHVQLANMADNLSIKGNEGSMTVPITVPGDLTRVRLSACYRTFGPKAHWDFEVSFDDGNTWKKAGEGPAQDHGRTAYVTYSDVPADAHTALVRYNGYGPEANMLGSFRVDADYKAANLGFSPVKVTYLWEENGVEKKNEHVAKSADDAYTINCESKPKMKSITLEVAE
jgi:hypothetical protein